MEVTLMIYIVIWKWSELKITQLIQFITLTILVTKQTHNQDLCIRLLQIWDGDNIYFVSVVNVQDIIMNLSSSETQIYYVKLSFKRRTNIMQYTKNPKSPPKEWDRNPTLFHFKSPTSTQIT